VSVTGQTDLEEDVRAYGPAKSGLVERQFMLSLVQTAEGLPIAHEVHPGNTAEAKTLLPMIRKLLGRYPLKRVVLVADRGLLSVGNLQELDKLQAQIKQDGRDVALEYILAVPAARYGDFAEDLNRLSDAQTKESPANLPWCSETQWQDKRLVAAHDPPRVTILVASIEPRTWGRRRRTIVARYGLKLTRFHGHMELLIEARELSGFLRQ
jgi:hypothetical protein